MTKMKTPTSAEEHARYMKEGSNGRANYKASVGNIGEPRNVRNEPDPKNRGGDYFSGSPSSFGGARNASLSKQAGKIDHSHGEEPDRKSTRLNSSHSQISYAVFCLKKKKTRIFSRLKT